MALIKNTLCTVTFTLVDGSTVEVKDISLQGERFGNAALDAFKSAQKVIPAFTADSKCWLNFNSIMKACVEETEATSEFEDPNCTDNVSE